VAWIASPAAAASSPTASRPRTRRLVAPPNMIDKAYWYGHFALAAVRILDFIPTALL
jgi:hypothetical protein